MTAVKQKVSTEQAPAAIGPYSQAIRLQNIVFLSGQIPLDRLTMEIVGGEFSARAQRVFDNLEEVCRAAGGRLDDIVKLTIYLTDLSRFDSVNELMRLRFSEPFPARAVVQVSALPRGSDIEIDGFMAVD